MGRESRATKDRFCKICQTTLHADDIDMDVHLRLHRIAERSGLILPSMAPQRIIRLGDGE